MLKQTSVLQKLLVLRQQQDCIIECEENLSEMDCNRDEATRAKEIAEKKLTEKDLLGAKKFASKAHSLFPGLEGLSQFQEILNVYTAGERKVNGEVDWYGVLGVDPLSDDETIRKKYRELALALHPDKNKAVGAEGAFKIISEAWSLLSDKVKRPVYDQKWNIRSHGNVTGLNLAVGTQKNGGCNFTKSSSGAKNSFASSTPQADSTPSRSNGSTFWTSCKRCMMQYEYMDKYRNLNLLCPNCRQPFLATEMPPPAKSNVSSRKHQKNQKWQSGFPAGSTSSDSGKKFTPTPKMGSSVFSHVDTMRRENIQQSSSFKVGGSRSMPTPAKDATSSDLGRKSTPSGSISMPTPAKGVAQPVHDFQSTREILKRRHEEAFGGTTNGFPAYNVPVFGNGEILSTYNVPVVGNGDILSKKVRLDEYLATLVRKDFPNQMPQSAAGSRSHVGSGNHMNGLEIGNLFTPGSSKSTGSKATLGKKDFHNQMPQSIAGSRSNYGSGNHMDRLETGNLFNPGTSKSKSLKSSVILGTHKERKEFLSRLPECSAGCRSSKHYANNKKRLETRKVTPGTLKSKSSMELSHSEARTLLMEKARMEIRKKLEQWSAANKTVSSGKVDKGMEKGIPTVSAPEKSVVADMREARNSKSSIKKRLVSSLSLVATSSDRMPTKVVSAGAPGSDVLKESLLSAVAIGSGTEVNKITTISVPDPEFYDFDKDRVEKVFAENQVWAAYDDEDGMPRYYAIIHNVISRKPFEVRISWLNSKSNSELGPLSWVACGFPKTCGDFRIGRHVNSKSLNSFSHRVYWNRGSKGVIHIFPRKGDVWALYRNWSSDWNELTPDEVIQKYDMVEVVEDYNKEQGVSVAPLVKVAGFRSVFHPHLDPSQVYTIPREEMFRFSHQVPSFILTGQEAETAPKGCRELDTAAMPLELLEIIKEPGEAEVGGTAGELSGGSDAVTVVMEEDAKDDGLGEDLRVYSRKAKGNSNMGDPSGEN